MRRWITAVALAGAAAFGLTGCGLPAGVDGKIADQWALPPAPQGFTPEAGKCHTAYAETGYLSSYQPIDCAQSHKTETVYVGTVDALAQPPHQGDADYLKVFQACEAKVNEFLGADWHDGRVWFGLTFPSKAAWTGGAHWYSCELTELEEVFGDEVSRTGSLRGELANAGSAIRLGCFSYASGRSLNPLACTTKHNSEYVGSVAMPSFAAVKDKAKMVAACRKRVAAYVGMKYTSDMRYRVGVFWDPMSEAEYAAGDRKVRCYAWFDPDTKRSSIKGAGAKALPIHYA